MKISKINELYKNSEKKIINNFCFFVNLFDFYNLFLPILFFLGIELQKYIEETNQDLYRSLFINYIISFFVLLFFNTTVSIYQHLYYKKQIIKHDSKCAFCKKKATAELRKIPTFFVIFGIPICEQHGESLNINPNNEQKLYKKYNSIMKWVNLLIIFSGIYCLLIFFCVNRNISIVLFIYVLFTIQVILYFYLYGRMFIKIRKGIKKTIEKEELE